MLSLSLLFLDWGLGNSLGHVFFTFRLCMTFFGGQYKHYLDSRNPLLDVLPYGLPCTIIFYQFLLRWTFLGNRPSPPNLKRNDNPSLKFDRQEYSQSHFRFQAYKSDLFGARYVWILIGTYTHEWWSVPDPTLRCTKEEMKKAVAYTFIFNNQIFVSEDKPKEAQNKTLSGLVSICALLKRKTKGSSQMLEQTLSYRCHAFLFFFFIQTTPLDFSCQITKYVKFH